MKELAYKKNAGATLNRLRALYDRKTENEIFVNFKLKSPTLSKFKENFPNDYCSYPNPKERIKFWDDLLQEKSLVEDDAMPNAYLSEFDQGLYGALIGSKMQFMVSQETGWISSMVEPMYKELSEFTPKMFSIDHPWWEKYDDQLQIFAKESENKFGISHFILIDSFNFIYELIGATQTYLSMYECPELMKKIIDFAFELNLKVQEHFFKITPQYKSGTFSNFAQWIPGKIVSESVDPFHMTSIDDFEIWGREPIERMFNHFDGGVIHIHSNGRHLLPAVKSLKGLKAICLLDEKDAPLAFDVLKELKNQVGDVPLAVSTNINKFVDAMNNNSLCGGVMYEVSGNITTDEANRIAEKTRIIRT